MDTFKTAQTVELFSSDVEGLKIELGTHLAKAMQRKGSIVNKIYTKVPMGIDSFLNPGEATEKSFVFSIPGILQDFMSLTPAGSKNITLTISVVCEFKTSTFTQELKDGLRFYAIPSALTEPSIVRITIANNSPKSLSAAVGFTFSEGTNDANLENQLI